MNAMDFKEHIIFVDFFNKPCSTLTITPWIAQKTNAYQLSKALLISENSEFDSKPELEIYADDVKCSHGSTSGNVDENSIHYLMTRGLTKKEATQLLINGFLKEIISEIKSDTIRKFVENKLEFQVYGY